MHKNIILLFLLMLVIAACGKKREPIYKTESYNKVENLLKIINFLLTIYLLKKFLENFKHHFIVIHYHKLNLI